MTLQFITVLIATYAYASVNSAILLSKCLRLPDPQKAGSKNPGAANMLRTGGKLPALVTLLFDLSKGFLPILGAFYLSLNSTQISIIAIISVIGHIYPIYTRFKGGKGVATALGCLFTLHPLIGCIFIATWLLIVRITQYASVASLGALLMAWLISIFLIPTYGIAIAIIFILVFAKHRDNLRKLLNGKENKLKL